MMARIIQKRKNQYNNSGVSTSTHKTSPAPAAPAKSSGSFPWGMVFEVIGYILLGALAVAAVIGIGWAGWLLLSWLCVNVLPVVMQFLLCCVGGVIAVFLLRSFAFRGTNDGAFALDIILTVIVAIILMSCVKSC